VNQYTLDKVFIKTYDSVNKAGDATGVNKGNIIRCCKKVVKKAGNYYWEYAKDQD
jgi:hypothetical protein